MRYYLKPRGEIWYICWTNVDGSPGRASTRTRDSRKAERKLAQYVVEHDRPQDQRLAETTLEAVLVRYWTHRTQGLADRGIVRRVIGLVCEHAPLVSLADFTIPRQEQFIREAMPNVSDGTRRRYMGVIEAAINWSFSRGELERVISVPLPQAVDGPGARPLTPAEIGRFLAAAETECEKRLAILLATTGPRAQAALQLDWSRVLPGAIDYDVPGQRRTKKRRARAPLAPTVSRWLEQRRSVGPVIQYAGKALKHHRSTIDRLMVRAGLDGTSYSVRKGLATWLAERDVPEWEVGRVLGHRVSSGTTERYAHHRPSYMRATREAVEELLRRHGPAWLVGATGIEPATTTMSRWCSTTELRAIPAGQSLASAHQPSPSNQSVTEAEGLHVKDDGLEWFQELTPANDDN
jgi:integrase